MHWTYSSLRGWTPIAGVLHLPRSSETETFPNTPCKRISITLARHSLSRLSPLFSSEHLPPSEIKVCTYYLPLPLEHKLHGNEDLILLSDDIDELKICTNKRENSWSHTCLLNYLFIYSFIHLKKICPVPGTILGAGSKAMNITLVLLELTF